MHSVNPKFKNSPDYFHRFSSKKKKRKSFSPQSESQLSENKKLNWEWYSPSEESLPVSFCLDTSLHGLKYIGQNKRHVFERLFWLAAFLASVITSMVLIWGMWRDYKDMPVVTVFNPKEKTLDSVPFPSVTICNVNALPHSAFDKQLGTVIKNLGRHLIRTISDKEWHWSLGKFADMDFICDSSSAFSERFLDNISLTSFYRRAKLEISRSKGDIDKYFDPVATLINVSPPCNKMILHCIWLDESFPCEKLFKKVVTDFGYCCTFNTLPLSLLMKYTVPKNYKPDDVERGWNETQLDYEQLIFTEKTKDRQYPYRQRYPGRSAGLSLFLNPELEEYFCTGTDSQGFMMGLNVPLDFPRVKDKGIAIKTNAEVFVGVRPEITMSDESVTSFPLEKRGCYYGNEFNLRYYTMYTASNCMNECIARKTVDNCGCGRYNMPRSADVRLCRPHEYNCTNNVTTWIIKNGLTTECNECLPTCTEIEYHKEVTILQPLSKKIKEMQNMFSYSYNNDEISIVHIFFNTDSVYPRLRKQWTSLTELLSNTGGLLGLCLGFSVLSLLEIFYYGTLRICCNFYREKAIRGKKRNNQLSSSSSSFSQEIDGETISNAKKGWFPRIFKATLNFGNIDKKKSTIEDGDDDGSIKNVFRVQHRNNLPIYFQSSFEDQFQKAFLAGYPDRYTYPK